MSRIAGLFILLATATALGCDTEPDTFVVERLTDFAFSDESTFRFDVDSVIYDPAVGGTARLVSRSTWTLSLLDSASDTRLYEVVVRDSTGRRGGGYLWDWTLETGSTLSQELDGRRYVTLTDPVSANADWDPLVFADRTLSLAVAGEPVSVHKGSWRARVDSLGDYAMSNGDQVEAAFVTIVDDENLIELREWKEVYGKDVGLLERRVRILDTQNTDAAVAWAQRAERGFAVIMRRR